MSTDFASTTRLRVALWLSVPANFGVAALLLMPGSPLGQLIGLPASVPILYSSLLALFIALFGGVYLWLVLQDEINRPLLTLGAIGKLLAFVCTTALWLAGLVSARWAALLVGDLLFAGLFIAWLWQHRPRA